jgi:nitrite reductase/ring-hydroxylating ferredoxin subunit
VAFIPVGKLSALAPDTVLEVMVGEQPYAICNVGGVITALNGVCLHRGGPLGQGQIHDGHVVCPYHMWEFDCRTGANGFDPTKGVATYEVKVEGDDILLQVP